MNTPARILLADDHEIVRDGLAAHLRMLGDFEIVHAWSLATLLAAAAPPGCDLAVVDVHMPGMDGGQGLAALCSAYPALPLIILSGAATLPHAGEWQCWPSVRAIIHKSSPMSQLRAAVDLALARAPAAPPPLPGPWGDADALSALSPRLAQVAQAVAQGFSNQQIADALGLSEGTVKQYLKDIFRSLGVTNRTQLALLLHRRG
ncbi:response regulator transcription factor [Ottowia thiooxydans]|uniref:response regulator transcription factor n=1 Tax=Ottowia thiooxydans TaxID=219182 RepID=UPI00041B4D54|nr:response regulator transcription factor [Ottowia thiooxydans]